MGSKFFLKTIINLFFINRKFKENPEKVKYSHIDTIKLIKIEKKQLTFFLLRLSFTRDPKKLIHQFKRNTA